MGFAQRDRRCLHFGRTVCLATQTENGASSLNRDGNFCCSKSLARVDVVFIPAQPHMVGGRAVAVVRIHGMKRPPARPPLRPHPACLPAHCTHRDDGGLAVAGTAAMQGRNQWQYTSSPGAGIESSKRRDSLEYPFQSSNAALIARIHFVFRNAQ